MQQSAIFVGGLGQMQIRFRSGEEQDGRAPVLQLGTSSGIEEESKELSLRFPSISLLTPYCRTSPTGLQSSRNTIVR